MSFPKEVKEKAAVACNRRCCICHEFKGLKLEFHHIKQKADGGADTFENCIPLCFDCHADMGGVNPKHPKGNAYSEKELRMHRDKWYEFIQNNSTVNKEKSEEAKRFLTQYNAVRQDVAENLAMYACCYYHPVDLARMPDHKLPPMHAEGSAVMRRLASRLMGLADSMSIDKLAVSISDEQLRQAAGCLYYMSNSFETPYATGLSQERHNCLMRNLTQLCELLGLRK